MNSITVNLTLFNLATNIVALGRWRCQRQPALPACLAVAFGEGGLLPLVATPLPQMLPLWLLITNDVTDVATFPTSYIYFHIR